MIIPRLIAVLISGMAVSVWLIAMLAFGIAAVVFFVGVAIIGINGFA